MPCTRQNILTTSLVGPVNFVLFFAFLSLKIRSSANLRDPIPKCAQENSVFFPVCLSFHFQCVTQGSADKLLLENF